MLQTFGTIKRHRRLLTVVLFLGLIGCNPDQSTHEKIPTTHQLEIDCADLRFELTTTLAWKTSCHGETVSLITDDAFPDVNVQLLSKEANDPLLTLLAMLRTQPGLHDVELHLTDVSVCGAFTCLSYRAKFQRLSQPIERLGVVAVDDTLSWEFTTSIDPNSSVANSKRPLALHALDDLTHRLSRPKS